MRTRLFMLAVLAALGPSCVACAQAPDYDFDWVTIGNFNNPAYDGPGNPDFGNYPVGHGSVGYTYRIARTEITTGQWLEFMNTFTTQPGIDAFSRAWFAPIKWGAGPSNNPNGPGILYRLEPRATAAREPVAGISWRQAAWYCNWLHNGKSSSLSALVTGAYDTTTWGGGTGTGRPATDAERHLPGARFWIPSIDEWIKAAHYDPDRYGPGQGGYWQYPTRSDQPPVPGAPGAGHTSATTQMWQLPVGSYPSVQSAYGLLDCSGGASEWVEDIFSRGPFYDRIFEGASADSRDGSDFTLDEITWHGAGLADQPGGGYAGLRVVSIPSPGVSAVFMIWAISKGRRVRRRL